MTSEAQIGFLTKNWAAFNVFVFPASHVVYQIYHSLKTGLLMKTISTLTALLASALIGFAGSTLAQKVETKPASVPVAPVPATAPAKNEPVKADAKAKVETKAEAKVELIDINSANKKALMVLPGIGEAYAAAIIKNRPYSGKDDLMTASNKSKKAIVPEKPMTALKI